MDGLPPLHAVRAFESAGSMRSIRRAAEALCVTPGAVSRQIKALEGYLGLKLFRREPGEIVLTAEGERYLAQVCYHLDGLRQATQAMTGRQSIESVRVRAYTTFAMKWLIPRLNSFRANNPNVEVRLETSNDPVDFERESVDCAIRLIDERLPGIEQERVLNNVLAPLCSPGFRDTHQLTAVADLAHVRLLHSLVRPDDWCYWLDAVGSHAIDAYAGDKFASSALAYQAAIEGYGIMMAPKELFEDDLASGRLVQPFSFELDRGDFTYYLLFPRERLRNPAFQRFRAWLLDEVCGAAPASSLTGSAPRV